MSEANTHYKELADSLLEVTDLANATDLAQSLESRPDFKFKGIFRVYSTILEWTNSFSSNGILPTAEQIARDNELDLERVQMFLTEMMARGVSNKTRLIVAIPGLDYSGASRGNLSKILVFARPGKADAGSAKRYYHAYQDKSLKAVSNWLDARPLQQGTEYSQLLHEKISQGRLMDTHYGAEIATYFYSHLDDTPERKKQTYTVFARPLLQRLIDNKKLLFLSRREKSRHPYKGVFLNRLEQLEVRFKVLADYLASHIEGTGSMETPDPAVVVQSLARYNDAVLDGMQPGHRQVVLELGLLAPAIARLRKDTAESKVRKETEDFIAELSRKPGIVEMARLKNMSEEVKQSLPRSSSILYAEYPTAGRLTEYVLHVNSVPSALKLAAERYEKLKDDTEVQILSYMGIEKYLDSDQMKLFQHLEQNVIFSKLPWFVKLWRSLFGDGRVSPEEAAKIRAELQKEREEEKLRLKTAEARKAQKELATQRMRGAGSESEPSSVTEDRSTEPKRKAEPEKQAEESPGKTMPDDPDAEEKLKKIIEIIDNAWAEKLFPNREYVLARLKGMDEDTFIMFLKKYGRKEILSFRIHHDKPEYQWPILVTRKYLNANGSKMLKKAKADADEQRKAMMPNQEKFDIATSIEDFINRLIVK